MGVIDSISEGLAVVRRRPYVMALPVIVDLLLWLAPRLSVQPLATQVAVALSQVATGTTSAESVDAARELVLSLGQDSNLLALLASSVIGIPSVVAGGLPEGTWQPFAGVEVSSFPLAILLALVLGLAGLAIAALYLTSLAQAVQGKKVAVPSLLRKALSNSVRLATMVLALIALALLVGTPFSLIVSVLLLISPTVAGLVVTLAGMLAIWAGLWALFYLFFVVDAMVLQETNLRRSVLNSVVVVRSSFWSALGFIILLNVLGAGFSVVWHWVLVTLPLGTVVAVVGNTFVGSGLVAASLVFYRSRYEALLAKVSA